MPEPPARTPALWLRGRVVLPPGSLGPMAQQLADLGQRMLDAAEHWATLDDYPMAAQCHQAAAQYFSASMLAEANKL